MSNNIRVDGPISQVLLVIDDDDDISTTVQVGDTVRGGQRVVNLDLRRAQNIIGTWLKNGGEIDIARALYDYWNYPRYEAGRNLAGVNVIDRCFQYLWRDYGSIDDYNRAMGIVMQLMNLTCLKTGIKSLGMRNDVFNYFPWGERMDQPAPGEDEIVGALDEYNKRNKKYLRWSTTTSTQRNLRNDEYDDVIEETRPLGNAAFALSTMGYDNYISKFSTNAMIPISSFSLNTRKLSQRDINRFFKNMNKYQNHMNIGNYDAFTMFLLHRNLLTLKGKTAMTQTMFEQRYNLYMVTTLGGRLMSKALNKVMSDIDMPASTMLFPRLYTLRPMEHFPDPIDFYSGEEKIVLSMWANNGELHYDTIFPAIHNVLCGTNTWNISSFPINYQINLTPYELHKVTYNTRNKYYGYYLCNGLVSRYRGVRWCNESNREGDTRLRWPDGHYMDLTKSTYSKERLQISHNNRLIWRDWFSIAAEPRKWGDNLEGMQAVFWNGLDMTPESDKGDYWKDQYRWYFRNVYRDKLYEPSWYIQAMSETYDAWRDVYSQYNILDGYKKTEWKEYVEENAGLIRWSEFCPTLNKDLERNSERFLEFPITYEGFIKPFTKLRILQGTARIEAFDYIPELLGVDEIPERRPFFRSSAGTGGDETTVPVAGSNADDAEHMVEEQSTTIAE